MNILDITAWVIIACFVFFVALPALFSGDHQGYWEAVGMGFSIVLALALVGSCLFVVLWAAERVLF